MITGPTAAGAAATEAAPSTAHGKPFVFLGPSLPLAEAQRILDAVYLPPVSMGDIYRLMARGPTVIAIIDGLFEQTPAVWHKEILFALSRGVRVWGASSMGALRAAELAAFGMEGVGEVFEAFHSGRLEDDDEVAVVHAAADDGYRSWSDAMVNLRAGLREAAAAGGISPLTHDRLITAGKDLFYPDRSWARLFQVAATLEIPAGELSALRERIGRHRPDVKRADAIQLLRRLATPEGSPAAPRVASFDFEPTYFWEQMILHEQSIGGAGRQDRHDGARPDGAREDGARDDGGIDLAALRRHVRLHASRARDALGTALLLYLAEEQAARRGLEHAGGAAAIDLLLEVLSDPINRRLPAALAHLGRLEPTLIEIRRKQGILRSLGLRAASPADAGLSLDDLLVWYERRFGPLAGSPEAHAARAGFASVEELIGEIALEYLAEEGVV
jgi:hypothetical protein